ncbi:hypothetical protein ACFLZN_00615 [Nanoarchaeota archaeon]
MLWPDSKFYSDTAIIYTPYRDIGVCGCDPEIKDGTVFLVYIDTNLERLFERAGYSEEKKVKIREQFKESPIVSISSMFTITDLEDLCLEGDVEVLESRNCIKVCQSLTGLAAQAYGHCILNQKLVQQGTLNHFRDIPADELEDHLRKNFADPLRVALFMNDTSNAEAYAEQFSEFLKGTGAEREVRRYCGALATRSNEISGERDILKLSDITNAYVTKILAILNRDSERLRLSRTLIADLSREDR